MKKLHFIVADENVQCMKKLHFIKHMKIFGKVDLTSVIFLCFYS